MDKNQVKQRIRHAAAKHGGKFPPLWAIAEALDIPFYKVKPVLSALVADGWLVRKGNWHRFADPARTPGVHVVEGTAGLPRGTKEENQWTNIPDVETPAEPVQELSVVADSHFQPVQCLSETPISEDVETPPMLEVSAVHTPPAHHFPRDWPVLVIRALMVVIGLGAAVMSTYYTTFWLMEFLPTVLAVVLGSIMVFFSVIAFETILIFAQNRQWPAAVTFVLIWVVVAAFSIVSTVAGQYNQHQRALVRTSVENVETTTSRLQLQTLREQRAEILGRAESKREQIASLNKILASVSDIEKRAQFGRSWADTQVQIAAAEKVLTGLQKEIDATRAAERELLAKAPAALAADPLSVSAAPDFYTWLAGVLRISRDLSQFWLSLFPAIFIDVIAPAALAVSMFLARKKRTPRL
jgi:hypothetical protein